MIFVQFWGGIFWMILGHFLTIYLMIYLTTFLMTLWMTLWMIFWDIFWSLFWMILTWTVFKAVLTQRALGLHSSTFDHVFFFWKLLIQCLQKFWVWWSWYVCISKSKCLFVSRLGMTFPWQIESVFAEFSKVLMRHDCFLFVFQSRNVFH